MYNTSEFNEHSIKQKVISVLRTFGSLGLLSDSDVKIIELQSNNNNYEISGEYKYSKMYYTDRTEKGTFNIILDQKLNVVKYKIDSQSTT